MACGDEPAAAGVTRGRGRPDWLAVQRHQELLAKVAGKEKRRNVEKTSRVGTKDSFLYFLRLSIPFKFGGDQPEEYSSSLICLKVYFAVNDYHLGRHSPNSHWGPICQATCFRGRLN